MLYVFNIRVLKVAKMLTEYSCMVDFEAGTNLEFYRMEWWMLRSIIRPAPNVFELNQFQFHFFPIEAYSLSGHVDILNDP